MPNWITKQHFMLFEHWPTIDQAVVVWRLDRDIHRMDFHPVDSAVRFVYSYPLGTDLSVGWLYLPYEQLSPGVESSSILKYSTTSWSSQDLPTKVFVLKETVFFLLLLLSLASFSVLFLILLILVKEINWHSWEKSYKEMINLTFLIGGVGGGKILRNFSWIVASWPYKPVKDKTLLKILTHSADSN